MKVLVTDKINESAGKIIEQAAEVDFLPTMSEEELVKIIPNYDALMVRSQTKVTAKIIVFSLIVSMPWFSTVSLNSRGGQPHPNEISGTKLASSGI